jgi:Leucine-rich repeat (LRR) protein
VSALAKTNVRGSMLPLIAMLVMLLAGDAIVMYYADRQGWTQSIALGFMQAQAGLFCILGGSVGRSWISSFLQATVLSVVSGLLYAATMLFSEDAPAPVAELLVVLCGLLPPVLFCGCAPLLLMRTLYGGHLSRRTTDLAGPYSLRMGDFFLAMTVIASLLAVANTVIGLESNNLHGVTDTLAMAALFAVVASTVAVLPVSIFYFKSTTRLGRILVLLLFAILGLAASGCFMIGSGLWNGMEVWETMERSVETMLHLATATVLFSLGLIVLHASGYRWRTIAKTSLTNESADPLELLDAAPQPNGYRLANRIAAACIVAASIALTISVSYWKQVRLRQKEAVTELNTKYVLEGGHVVQEGDEVFAVQAPQNTDCSNLVLSQFRGLTSISLVGAKISDALLSSISKKHALRYVDLSHASIDDSNIKHLFSRRVFTKLSLAGTQLTVKGINDAIAGCPTFVLDIGELDLNDDAMSQLKLKNQRGLILRGNPITDKSLEPLTSLQYLDLSSTKCTGSALEHLTQVFTLKLDGTLVDDAVIAKLLSANSVLKNLSIRNTRVTDATLKDLAQHVSLTGLEIGDGEITAEGLIATAFAPADRLALNSRKFTGAVFANWRPSIRCLDMSDSGLSDADLHHLGNIVGLQELSLANCDVSDESLAKLEALNLAKLDLTGTNVTGTAVSKLFQGSTVVHLSPAQCSQEEIAQSNTRGGLRIGVRFDLERY